MSRKSRPRSKLALVPDERKAAPSEDTHETVYRLTGKHRDMLEAIVSNCAIAAFMSEGDEELFIDDLPNEAVKDDDLWDDELDELDEDEDAYEPAEDIETSDGISQLAEAFGGVALTTRLLARELLAHTLDRPPVQVGARIGFHPPAPTAEEDAALDRLVASLLPANLPPAIRPAPRDRREALNDAAWFIREVGLEEFDVACELESGASGALELLVRPVSRESAHVALLEYVFNRAEGIIDTLDPLLMVERDASFWEFSRWNVAAPPGHPLARVSAFSGAVREQEYSLVERTTVALGTPVMGEIAADSAFGELFPRQYHLATALTASFVDVFECIEREGTRTTLRSVRHGRTFSVHEHMGPLTYDIGWFAMGRLIPFEDDVHLRSPGMLFLKPEADSTAFRNAVVDAFSGPHAPSAPALALERLISSAMFGVPTPRAMKPARSKRDARELLGILDEILAVPAPDFGSDRSRSDVVAAADVMYYTPGLSAGNGAANDDDEIELDETMRSFIAALEDQAMGGGPERQQRARTAKQKGKRRR